MNIVLRQSKIENLGFSHFHENLVPNRKLPLGVIFFPGLTDEVLTVVHKLYAQLKFSVKRMQSLL